MPNWTTNKVTVIEGNVDLRKYCTTNEQNVDYFDFNKLVPQPTSKEECLAKYGQEYIDDGSKHLQHTTTDIWLDWYRWNCDFWGTKWNSCDAYFRADGTEVSFDTAWTEPKPIWKALSEQNPKATFEIAASYEDSLETRSVWRNGKMLSSMSWEREYYDDENGDEYDE